jgi:hypothetical protein
MVYDFGREQKKSMNPASVTAGSFGIFSFYIEDSGGIPRINQRYQARNRTVDCVIDIVFARKKGVVL